MHDQWLYLLLGFSQHDFDLQGDIDMPFYYLSRNIPAHQYDLIISVQALHGQALS